MNLKQLDYFIAVAECLNFTKAAEKCYISQTAMTQQIKSLEENVGVALFIRDKHHVELTAAGKIYLNEARLILEHHDEALKLARLVSEGTHGEINIGFINGFGQSEFTEILRNFHKAYPNIQIHLHRNNYVVLREMLDRGECDVVFVVSSYERWGELYDHRLIKSYPIMAVLDDRHEFANKKQLTYQELEHENFIMMQPADRKKSQMEESVLIYERGGYIPNVVAVESEQETLLLMVSVGIGISLMPEYTLKLYQDSSNLRIIPMIRKDGISETLDVEVCWKKANVNPAVEKLLELC